MPTEPEPASRWALLASAVVLAAIAEHVVLAVAPLDVLAPIDPSHIGRLLLHGGVPYRDFAFEYPPLAVVAFILPGLLPSWLGLPAMAVQAAALEAVVLLAVLRHHSGAACRYAALSLVVWPFLSGGFDAFPMAAIAISTALLAESNAAGWWVAALGTATKLVPGAAWVWGRRPLRAGAAALGVGLLLAVGPALLAPHADDSYLGYTVHRGVEVESVGASTAWVAHQLTGRASTIVYRFRSNELEGAGGAALIWAVIGVVGLALLAAIAGWRRTGVDPWLASFVAVLLFMVASKVLSPQFVAWPAPLAAVLGRRWWRAWLAIAALTALGYALDTGVSATLAVIAVRNAALVATSAAGLLALARQRRLLGEPRP